MNESLQLLVFYIVWKARMLQSNPPAEAEKDTVYEELRVARDALAERLTEFAVGTQSNTAEGVKRSVSIISSSSNYQLISLSC